MAKLRKMCAYRRTERPYTRLSKYKAKSYIRAKPSSKIVRFEMGNQHKSYDYTLSLVSKQALQIRHNSIEAARQTTNRKLEKLIGKGNYFMKIRIFPHHILRENPLASGAGADRMSTGMKMSFGKAIGSAAQVKKGQTVVNLNIDKQHLTSGKEIIRKFIYKFPGSYAIVTTENISKEAETPKVSKEAPVAEVTA